MCKTCFSLIFVTLLLPNQTRTIIKVAILCVLWYALTSTSNVVGKKALRISISLDNFTFSYGCKCISHVPNSHDHEERIQFSLFNGIFLAFCSSAWFWKTTWFSFFTYQYLENFCIILSYN